METRGKKRGDERMHSRGERKNVVCRQISQPSSSASLLPWLPWLPWPPPLWPLIPPSSLPSKNRFSTPHRIHDLPFRRRSLRLALAVLPRPFSRVLVRWVRSWWIPVGSSSEVLSTVIFFLLRLPSKFLWAQLLFLFYKVSIFIGVFCHLRNVGVAWEGSGEYGWSEILI